MSRISDSTKESLAPLLKRLRETPYIAERKPDSTVFDTTIALIPKADRATLHFHNATGATLKGVPKDQQPNILARADFSDESQLFLRRDPQNTGIIREADQDAVLLKVFQVLEQKCRAIKKQTPELDNLIQALISQAQNLSKKV
jgi:hypothetical protein